MINKLLEIKDVIPYAVHINSFIFAISVFLDDFKYSNNDANLLLNEPIIDDYSYLNIIRNSENYISAKDNENNLELCLLAGIAEKLCNENNLIIPDWVNKQDYFLKSPYFGFNTKDEDFKKFLLENAEPEFKKRNMFILNVINRV